MIWVSWPKTICEYIKYKVYDSSYSDSQINSLWVMSIDWVTQQRKAIAALITNCAKSALLQSQRDIMDVSQAKVASNLKYDIQSKYEICSVKVCNLQNSLRLLDLKLHLWSETASASRLCDGEASLCLHLFKLWVALSAAGHCLLKVNRSTGNRSALSFVPFLPRLKGPILLAGNICKAFVPRGITH